MFYTYVLLGLKSKKLYIGCTEDLKQRLKEHNTGIGGKYTSKNKPFKLVFLRSILGKKRRQKTRKIL
jgi:putative endonuclease